MLFRFSLYGFLKNQQYYDPFIILAFREKGLTFFQIGILIGFREVCVNLMEIPTGVIADMYGRRLSMMSSMAAYIFSFVVLAISDTFWLLCVAMLLFAIGEAFRTGTHKAMIFEWLRHKNRTKEKTKVYGYTRSWSKIGSALSVIIAAALVFYSGRYSHIFWFSIPPYLANIINFLGYPKYLDGEPTTAISLRKTALALWHTLKDSLQNPTVRRIYFDTMGFEGMFKVAQDYIQPILKQAAVALPVLLWLSDDKRSAVLVGVVYFILYVLSTVASRQSHVFSDRMQGEDGAILTLWKVAFVGFVILVPALWFELHALSIAMFVVLFILQNLWRPVQIARFDTHSDPGKGATILSIDSQAKSAFTMFMAPILGFLVDHLGFWPVGAVGALIAALAIITAPRRLASE